MITIIKPGSSLLPGPDSSIDDELLLQLLNEILTHRCNETWEREFSDLW